MQVVNVNWLVDNVVAEVVGFAVSFRWLDAPSGEPNRETAGVVVAAIAFVGHQALAVDGAPELPAPHHQRFVEQSALFEVPDQRCRGLVGIGALLGELVRQRAVLIPSAMKELDEAHAALHQPSRDQTVARVRSRLARSLAVEIERGFRLVREIH